MNIIIYNPQNIGILEDLRNSNNFVFIEFEQKTENQTIREDDIWFNAICEKINDFNFDQHISSIIVPNNLCNSIHRLELHLRLHNWNKDKEYIKEIPVFFIEIQNLDNIGETEDKQLYDSEKSKIECTNPEYFIKNIDEIIKTKITDYKIKDYSNISIQKSDNIDRHSYANEWGVVELAQADEFYLEFKLPPHLHLKHKIFKENIQFIEKNNEKQKFGNYKISNPKILLVDDYCEKGWTESICKILNRNVLDKDNQLKITDIQTAKSEDEFNKIFKNQFFNLVFLDLRLPKNGTDNVPNIEVGLKILEKIKENPSIPVIILTASNKAWNMEKVFELGADGYFIKSSPDERFNLIDSKEKVKNFIDTLNKIIEKGYKLQPYWDSILSFNKSNLIKGREKTNRQNNIEKVENRVDERLKMSFGLIKMNFERTKYNKVKFFYSDIELAYLTLWSILNEISHNYYQKNEQVSITINNQSVNRHLNNRNIWEKSWKLRTSNDYFIKRTPKVTYDGNFQISQEGYFQFKSQSQLEYDKTKQPYFSLNNSYSDKSYESKISMQIAYILLKKSELQQITNNEREVILIKLKEANDLRNTLYLTHGEEIENEDIYSDTIENQRINTRVDEEKYRDLFELIYFLLTGKKM